MKSLTASYNNSWTGVVYGTDKEVPIEWIVIESISLNRLTTVC